MNPYTERSYEFGPFRLDTGNRQLLRDGEVVPLAPKAYDTLLALVENSGRVLDKPELLKRIWPDTFVEEINLTVHISALRKALGENPNDNHYIETIPRRGYRFVAEVNGAAEPHYQPGELIDGQGITTGPASPVVRPHDKAALLDTQDNLDVALPGRIHGWATTISRKRKIAALSLLAVLLGVSLYWISANLSAGPAESGGTSIAVLPLKHLNSDTDEYLGVGIADALITKMSNIRQIVVRPTWAVLKYERLDNDPLEAGRELGVDSILSGVVQRSGSGVRVTVQLVRVKDGASLWAGTFEEDFTNIFAVQDQISRRVADSLTVRLTGEEKMQLARYDTRNADAYRSYLRGRYCVNKSTPDSVNKGIQFFEEAIGSDRDYAAAYAGLADCYTLLGFFGTLPPWEATPKAKAAVMAALERDDTLAEAHTSLAMIKMHYDRDWPGALKEFRRAIELNPNDPISRVWHAWCLLVTDRLDESMSEIMRAQQLDPVSILVNTQLGLHLYYRRDHAAAINQLKRTIDMEPSQVMARQMLALAYIEKGMHGDAIAELTTAMTLGGGRSDMLAYAHAVSGRRSEALKAIDELREKRNNRYISPYTIARIYSGLRDSDLAVEWLERAFREHDQKLFWLKVDPTFDTLREDPRVQDLLQRMGLQMSTA